MCMTAAGVDTWKCCPALHCPSAELLAEEGWWPDVIESPGSEAGLGMSRALSVLVWALVPIGSPSPPKPHRTPMSGGSVAKVSMGHP